ncbi:MULTISPECIES: RagB/SusD family nutrient uptake outer membrane protein [Proteiniphilum]|jgi:hypothetical protein|uniref:RagB/SusD family nutrient uptake outer membrane protein n=3 Tax=Dysgonomonadaceae TaxID=2005520 RepID=UPI001EEC5D54|nr:MULTISPECIES: RagB/SusD family nutrient uptake outer membrane protein [Proteiniphilum]ULB35027.1 RagB/SusD family nutrient uptake outer membrane protein [Proteiniphilum propionicum]
MNKNIKISVMFLFLFGLVTSSCNDYLDREPLSQITPNTFLKTDNDLAAYAVNLYTIFPVHGVWGSVGTFGNDRHTDNQTSADYSTRWVPGQWRVPETDSNNDSWKFEIIRSCNYFLETVLPRYEGKELTGNDVNLRQYIGEVYFIRAYDYFTRLKELGDFPIITTQLPDDMAALTEASVRAPRNEVARFILSDLDKAIEYMNNAPVGGKNRLTKNAALLMKSRVALFEASWLSYHKGTALVPGGPGWPGKKTGINIETEISFFLDECMKASKELADAIPLAENNGGYANNPYYIQFADKSLEKYPEILFWRAYEKDLGSGNDKLNHSASSYLRHGGNNGFTRQFVETFLCSDGKPIYASSLYQGDLSIESVRENRDNRLQIFMMTPGEKFTTKSDNLDKAPLLPNVVDLVEVRPVTGYVLRKGLSDEPYAGGGSWCVEGCPIFRVTEAYLNYIEASCIKNGGNSVDATADKYWKQLRTRAMLPADYAVTVAATDLSKESDWGKYSGKNLVSSLLYNIRRERRCELMEESFRMDDLKRWRALDNINGFMPEGFRLWGSHYKPLYEAEGKIDAKKVLIPAPAAKANVSSPDESEYIRPYRINLTASNYVKDGYKWCEAHYLSPINIEHFRITATNPDDPSTSVIYQNPGWPLTSNSGAIGY